MTARRSVPPPSVTAASHSVVDAISPEPTPAGVVRLLSAGEAQRLTQRIKLAASSIREGLFKLQNLVDEAKNSNAWKILGFASWTAYLVDTLGDEPMRVSKERRQELVGYLSGEGLSSRAIAPIVGVDRKTVDRDIAGGANVPPADNATESEPRHPRLAVVDLGSGEVTDAEPEERKVTGLDGKSYTRPTKPVTERRIPLTDDAHNAGYTLRKAIERLDRIRNDDRFERNRAEILKDLRPHLDFARDVLNDFGVEGFLTEPSKENS